ncbi:hemagglutinin repeat-containing protein, partial [Pseudomonas gingeri]|uniref:hemagglutinin repeat-containing protein n=1 Tax=Pseudomonas gingeri TaxID=117681 RepID=UPI0015A2DAA4
QFSDYNVGANGVILNNATARTQSTQLGGIILGNQNLNGTAANVILNEVTGASPSQLRGYTEVAGQSAHVIVANPYGISCNGCGFINTPQATLTTGKPVITNGQVTGYQVDQGSVSIDGAGLNASNIDQFEIITRAATINAQINAKQLTIIAGRNDVDAQSLKATARADDGSAKPQVAIDSTALGGMYAGAIKLVGTEAGVGVKLAGNLAASGGDIQLDANGQLSMVQATASGAVNVKAASLDAQGPIYAGSTLNVQTTGDLTSRNNLAARDSITLGSGGQLTNNGIIEAGVNADNSRNTTGDVSVTAQNVTNNGQSVIASRDLSVTVTQALNNQGGTLSGQRQTRVSAATLDNQNKGRVLSGGTLNLNAGQVLNAQAGLITSNGELVGNVGSLGNNGGQLSSLAGVTLTVATLDNVAGLVSAGNALSINASGALNNRGGSLSSAGIATLKASSLDNTQGQLTGDLGLSIDLSGALDNHAGMLGSGKALSLTAASLDNRAAGTLLAAGGSLTATLSGAFDNREQGKLRASQAIDLNTGSLDNRGGSLAGKDQLTLRSASVDNRGGVIQADKDLKLLVDQLDNRDKGNLIGKAALGYTGTRLDNSGGLLSAVGPVTLTVQEIANAAGRIASQGDLTANVDTLNQQGGALVAQGSLLLTGKTLDNRNGGTVASTQALVLKVDQIDNRGGELSSTTRSVNVTGQSLNNSDGGKLLSETDLGLSVAQLINQTQGRLFAKGNLNLSGTSLDNSGGNVSGLKGLDIRLDGALLNNTGLLSSEGALTLNVASLDNRAGKLGSGAALSITSLGALLNQGGSILADQGLTLASASLDNSQQGVINGKGTTRITTGTLDNSQGGHLTSDDSLELTATQVSNGASGRIASAKDLTASVTGLDQQGGELFSKTRLSLDLHNGQLNNQHGVINGPLLVLNNLNGVANQNGEISSAQAYTLAAQSLDNSNGKLLSDQGLTLRIDQALNNQGGTISAASLDSRSASLDNSHGLISSRGAVDLGVTNAFINQNGTLIGDGAVLLTANSLDNSNGAVSGKADVTATVASVNNQNGQLIATGALSLNGGSLDNRQGGLVGATKALKLNVDQVDNRGGELSSNADLTLSGTRLDNSDGGKVLSDTALGLKVAQVINQSLGQLRSQGSASLSGSSLDNSGGTLSAQSGLVITLDNALTNRLQGLISSEGNLTVSAASLDNSAGSLSSAGALSLTSTGALINQGGRLVTDQQLTLNSASLDNRQQGLISAKGAMGVTTGAYDNSTGNLSSADSLTLTAGQVTNQGGSIGSEKALTASVSGLDQQGGKLFSHTALSLDLNNGQLNNQNGLINAPSLLLNNLKGVNNQGGEISSAQAFSVIADSLDNSNGKLLSNQAVTLRVNQALTNLKGQIAAAALDLQAASLDNSGGTLTSRSDLSLTTSGLLTNQNQGLINAVQSLKITSADLNNQGGTLLGTGAVTLNAMALNNTGNGLINSQGGLTITANSLDSSNGGEVSAKGDIGLNLGALTQNGGRLLGSQAINLDLAGGDLDNRNGLLNAQGPLSLNRLRDLNNQNGELSSSQSFNLTGRTLDNSGGKLISNNQLGVTATSVINQGGLLSGWQGLAVNGGSLDNRNSGTLSSRNGNLDVTLSGALLNGNAGALVSQQALTLNAASLDNSAGILSSGAAQQLTVSGLLNNASGGSIDSGTALTLNAMALNNGGSISAQQALGFTGTTLDNTGGSLTGNGAVNLDLLGVLTNTNGKLASAGPLLISRSSQINNQGGQLVSQGLLSVLTGGLDNSNRGTVAANDVLTLTSSGAVQNSGDGLIYSQNADVKLSAASLANGKGTVQSQGALNLTVTGDIDNQSGKLLAQNGDLNVGAANLDNRGGTLASIKGALEAHIVGVLKNGYDLNNNRQGGTTQAQRLNLSALGGIDNYGGRISAQSGDAVITTTDFDNRNGGLYAKGLVKVSGNNFDNSGDNDGRIAGQQIDLSLNGALNNRLGIIESDSTLSVRAASLDNQTGQLRALGTSGKTNFQIGGLFDNRNGKLETANSDLTVNAAGFQNLGGSLLHVGNGTFDIATANILNAGGSLVTRGGLTLTADNWTNSSVIQAGRLTVNVNTLNQTAGGQLLASTSLTGNGGNWNNDGLIASDGTVNLNLSGSYGGNGRLSSLGTLGLTAASVNVGSSGSIAGGGDTTINVGGQLNNYGRLTSAAGMTVNAGGINNYGTLGSSQALTATTGALLNDHGLIFSGSDMGLRVDSLTNSYGNIYSLGNLKVDRDGLGGLASSILNSSGSIQSDGSMSLSASTIKNVRAVLTTNNLGLYTASITETQCIEDFNASDCSDGKMNHVWQITQRDKFEVTEASAASSITAGTNLSIQGGDLLNQSSTIAAGGSFSAQVNNLTNSGLETGETETSRIFVSERTRHPEGWYANAAAFTNQYWFQSAGYNPNNLGGLQAAMSAFIGSTEREWVQLRTTRKLDSGDQSYAAVIQAGGAVNVRAQSGIDNSVVRPGYTYVGAGPRTDTQSSGSNFSTRITVNSQLPPNLAQQQVNPLALPGFSLPTGQNGLFRLSGQGGSLQQASQANSGSQSWNMGGTTVGTAQRQQSLPQVQVRDGQVGDISQVTINDRQLTQTTRQATGNSVGASVIDVGAPVDSGSGAIQLPGHDSNIGVNPISEGQPLARVQGLPDMSVRSSPQKYLIETNPVLTDLKQFMSSDYLLSGLGYNPDDSAKRLGDGFYEQKLIQQAVTARTGQRFIDGQTSDDAMFKYLMNNAITSKQALNLQLGVSLTSEQVAALTHDIVWMENQTVNGEQVLVPVLYLANASNRLAANGALIQGSDVSLIAGKDLNNAGTLRASNNLSVTAGNDLTNSGLLEAGNRLDALAGNNLVNKAGGIIAGRDVSVTATTGDVINERTITTHESGIGEKSEQRGFADSAARIEAGNSLTVSAGRDIDNSGGVLKSTLDTTLKAGRDVNITSAEQVNSQTLGVRSSDKSVVQNGSSVTAGRDLTVSAGRDLTAIASQIDAKRDVALSAVGDLTLASAADEQHSFVQTNKITRQEDHTQQVATSVTAGGNVTLSAGKDLGLIASKVSAGEEAYLSAGANLALQTAANEDYSFYSKVKKSSSGKSSQLDETSSTTNMASSVTSGKNSTLVAGQDLIVKGSEVAADQGAAKLVAGHDVQIIAVTDSNSARHESSKSKSSWGGLKSSKVQDAVSETQTTAVGSVISGNTVDVAALHDVTVTGSGLASTQDLTVQAGRDLVIDAAQNTFTRSEMHKEKSHDLTGVLTANNMGIDDITGNMHLSISSRDHEGQSAQTTLTGSTVGSSQGNVTLAAGRELSVIASDLVSTKNMNLTGANVSIAAGMESASQSSTDKSSSLAVGRVIGGSVVDTFNTIRSAVKAASNADDPKLKAVKLAQAALAGYNLGGASSDAYDGRSGYANKTGGANSNGSLIKIGTELASTHTTSTSEYDSQTAKQSSLMAGKTLTIIADGRAPETVGDIHVIGSGLKAADTMLLAKNNITLESTQDTANWANDSKNSKTAIGASFNIGEQNGFTLDLGASIAKSMGTGGSVTQVNSTLDTGSLLLSSGQDTTLAGAQVRADSIKADIGGNLNITSRQDSETQKSKQGSAGFGASICIPPFCYGSTVAASASLAAGNMNSNYKAVTDQSGLFAGGGGYNIHIGDNTLLQGAVIASDASADKNLLDTNRLIVSDIKNTNEIKSQSVGLSLSYGGNSGSAVGGSVPLALSDSDRSKTRSAVSEGTIVVRSTEGANDLVGLNRDTANANQKLDKPDQKAMQERIDLIQSTVQLSTGIVDAVAKAKSDAASKLAEQAKTDATLVPAANAAAADAASWNIGGDKRIMADIVTGLLAAGLGGAGGATAVGIVANTTAADTYKKIGDYADQQLADATRSKDASLQAVWAEGGSARILLHSLAGALQGLSSGTAASGALSAGASAAVMPTLDQVLKNNGIGPESRDALGTWIAAGVGAAVTGGSGSIAQASGAVIAGNIDKYNRQAHPTEARLIEEEAPKLAAELGISPAEAEQKMARAFAFYTDAQWKQTIGGVDSQFDAATLEHLGAALASLADRYAVNQSAGDVPKLSEGPRTYTSAETTALLKNYQVDHAASYNDPLINGEYLISGNVFKYYSPEVSGQIAYYGRNLNYNDPSLGSIGTGSVDVVQGLGSGFYGVGKGIYDLGSGLVNDFSGTSSQVANGLLGVAAGTGWDGYRAKNNEGQILDYLASLQGYSSSYNELKGKQIAEDALYLIPAGRVGALGKVSDIAEWAGGVSISADKTVSLFGFRGAGSTSDLLNNATHPYVVTGHVGYSFDGGKTIYGFGPSVPEGMPAYDAIQSLRGGVSYPGVISNDTSIFESVANNPVLGRGGAPQTVYQQQISVSQAQFDAIQAAHDSIGVGNPMGDVLYGFPAKGGAVPVDCYFNCATFPSSLGIPIPESTGAMRTYMPQLEQLGMPWRPPK